MAAYLVVQSTIADEAQYQRYRAAVVPLISSFGGKIAARGAKVEILEGGQVVGDFCNTIPPTTDLLLHRGER